MNQVRGRLIVMLKYPRPGAVKTRLIHALGVAAGFHGLPVSTTHVRVSSLFGLGLATRQMKWKPVLGVLAAWVVTLPCTAFFTGLAYKFTSLT